MHWDESCALGMSRGQWEPRETAPLPVWGIGGKPHMAGARVNGDLGWSPPDNKVGRQVGQRPRERKQKENK